MKKIIRRTYSSYESFTEAQESGEELKAKKKKKYIKIAAAAGLAVGAGSGIHYLHTKRKINKVTPPINKKDDYSKNKPSSNKKEHLKMPDKINIDEIPFKFVV